MTIPSDKAFPNQPWMDDYGAYYPGKSGLTKREYFAAQALMGLMASDGKFHNWQEVADSAVGAANALIAALNEERNSND